MVFPSCRIDHREPPSQQGHSACTVMAIRPFEHIACGWAVTTEKSSVDLSELFLQRGRTSLIETRLTQHTRSREAEAH